MKTTKPWLITIAMLLCSLTVSAHDCEVDGIYYNLDTSNSTASVTYRGDYYSLYENEYTGNVVIPESILRNGVTYRVTSIGSSAFRDCSGLTSVTIGDGVTSIGSSAFRDCSGLTSVTIGDGVTSIGSEAFYSCSGLTSINIPDGVTSIGNSAFEGCSGLTSVTIGNGVTSIGIAAFEGCSGLSSITIPDGVTSIDSYTFSNCTGLTSIDIPDGVMSIGSYAFLGCTGLTSIDIPDGVTSIGIAAFRDCSGLTSIVIPDGVMSIGSYAFLGCTGLTSIVIPDGVTSTGESAFSGCTGLTSIVIPDGVTSIGGGAFSYCSGLTSIVIPDGVTSIGGGAFYKCTGLTSINIPDGVTSIGSSAFYGCSGLSSINIPDGVTSIGSSAFYKCTGLTSVTIGDGVTSIGSSAFYKCTGLTSINIPDGVTSIGSSAFYGCSGLSSINIPDGVTSIGSSAFSGCKGLTTITCLAINPPTMGSSVFNNVDKTIPLYVPASSVSAYQSAAGWSDFTNILPLKEITLKDGGFSSFTQAGNEEYNEITYTRTLPNLMWNALYLPFEIPMNHLSENYDVAYINDVRSQDTDEDGSIDKLEMEIIKIKEGTLHANFPYLIRAKNEEARKVEIKVTDATLYATEENSVSCSSVFMNYEVKGIYAQRTAAELEGCLTISTTGAWQPLAAGTALNPFRLYLKMTAKEGSPVKVNTAALKSIRMRVLGEDDEEGTTAIENVVNKKTVADNAFYDLQGRRVMTPVEGRLYICNGKKVIY